MKANRFTKFAFSANGGQPSDVKLETNTEAAAPAVAVKRPLESTGCDEDIAKRVRVKIEKEGEAEDDRKVTLLRDLIRARMSLETPIDLFGTQMCVAPGAHANQATWRFQLLVAALLSAQTRDELTFAAMQRLHQHSDRLRDGDKEEDKKSDGLGLTVDSVRETPVAELATLLQPVGFYRRKAQQMRRVAATLHSQYHDDIPDSLADLEALPGIGPKIARVVLLLAWDRVDGIIVDTHVHRLAHRLGWVGDSGGAAESPEATRRALEAWVPREYWGKLSLAVVGFGQQVCTARNPKCGICPLSQQCPSAFKVGAASKKSEKVAIMEW